jgi:hypothetical protein
MGNLSNLYISQSFPSLAHLGTNAALVPGTMTELQDGIGQSLNISFDGTNISSSGNIFAANITASVINTGSLVSTASFNQYTSSTNIRLNNLETTSASVNVSISNLNAATASQAISISNLNAATASYVTETESGSFLLTASFDNSSRNLTFTKGNNTTFNVNIPDVSGSTFNTGSFATTGSNTFTGVNYFSQSVQILGSLDMPFGNITMGYPKQMGDPYNYNAIVSTPGVSAISGGGRRLVLQGDVMGSTANKGVTILNGLGITGSVVISPLPGMTPTGGDLDVAGTFTASLQQGYVWVGDSTGKTVTVATSSFFTSGSGPTDITALNAFTASQQLLNTTFATTGSNTFRADQTVSASILVTGNVEMNQDVNAGILFPMSGSKSVRIQKQVGINRLSWVDQDNDKLLYLDVDSGVFFVSGNFQAGLQNGYAWVGQADGYSGQVATSSFGSGGSINTGSFATTGSNTFTGIQNFTAEITASNTIINGDLIVNPNTATNLNGNANVQNFLYVGAGQTMGGQSAAITWLGSGSIDGTFSASVDSRINAITGSGGSVNTGSLMVTGSISGNTLTFTKGDASTFNLTIPSATGSVFDTGSFATTGSNTFNGDQSITGSLSVFLPKASGKQFRVDWGNAGSASMFTEESGGPNQSLIIVSASIDLRRGGIDFTSGSIRNSGDQIQFNASPSASFILRTSNGGTAEMTAYTDFIDLNRPYGQVRANSNGDILVRGSGGSVTITGSAGTVIEGLTYPQTDGTAGQVLTTNGSKVLSFTTISGGGGTAFANPSVESISGSLLLTANTFTSGAANLSHLTASAQNQSNLVFKNNNNTGTTIISGSNNIFTNPTIPTTGRINYIGGSSNLFLNGQSQNLPQITGSAASVSGNRPTMNGNIINGTQAWTINQAVNPGSHTYSNNILAGTGTWTYNTLGNTGAVTVSNNIGLSSTMTLNSPSRSIAQVNAGESGSNALTIQNNTIAGTLNYNGPVSSSSHTIQNNSIQGTYTLNVQSQSRAITSQANIINGQLTFNDNTVFAPTLGASNNIQQNNINGSATFTLAGSSSFSILNNNLNSVTITSFLNASSIAAAGQRLSTLNANAIFGSNNSILFSGSQGAAPTGRGLLNSLIAGQFNSASLIGDGSGSNMVGTAILGGGLNVIGTTTIPVAGTQQNYGSAFFGRWNAEDGNRAKTAETIFAVGTGTSGSAGIVRKTGFLIDSGSNSFVEGTLNVSGSTTLSGSLYIQSASAFPTQIGTSLVTWDATTGQVGQATTSTLISSSFSAGEFYSMTTLSGSAGVSASIELPNTAISNGVSIQSNSQIVVQNTGVYNIQFSAQADAFGGADTIWIWFKKNGTNIADSASKLIMQNNTAAIMTVNIFDNALPNDYFEVVWQNNAGAGKLISDAATGNIPGIPSVIVTVNQVK